MLSLADLLSIPKTDPPLFSASCCSPYRSDGVARMVKKLSPTPEAMFSGPSFAYEQEISTG